MSADIRSIIENAILFLAGRCDHASSADGRGYSKWDARWGHEMADRIAGGGHVPSLKYAHKVITKYRCQLAAAAIELPPLDVVEEMEQAERVAREATRPAEPKVEGITVTRVGESLRIRFPYDPALIEKVRSLPDRKWDPASKSWVAPMRMLEKVLETFPDAVLDAGLAEQLAESRAKKAADEVARVSTITADTERYEAIFAGLTPPLYAHQDVGVRWLIEHRRAILADDMGLGKTRQALVASRALNHRIVVICPAGLRENWRREAQAVGARIEVYSWAKVPEVFPGEYTLIADEAHYAQNMKAARTKRYLTLAAAATAHYALTGTPIKNGRPTNLFPLLVATKHELAANRKAYEQRYCNAHPTQWSAWDVTGAAHLDELHQKLSDGVLRRMKDECLDLPAKVRVLRKAELSAESAALYRRTLEAMQREYLAKKERGEVGEADALVMMNHVRHAASLAKVESAIELAEEVIEQGGQVVVFTAFLDSCEQLATALNAARIAGDVDTDTRQAAIDAFQAGERKAIVCTLGAGNVGITLTAAQTVILVDRPWTPGDAIQAEDRCHRIGQKGSVVAVWLQANGADEAIDDLLEQKHERIELVLAGKRKSLRGLRSVGDVARAVLDVEPHEASLADKREWRMSDDAMDEMEHVGQTAMPAPLYGFGETEQ